jgi:acetyl esterase/lipase
VVRPASPNGTVILHLHGERNTSAGPVSSLDAARRLAGSTGAVVVCARYRSTFPAALRDAKAGYRYCQDTGAAVVVTGERMGAALAAALLVELRNSGAALPRCAVLLSALLDMTLETKSLSLNASADPALDVTELRQRVADYAGDTVLTDSRLSPLYANLHGLPPIQLLVAGTDPLLDDSLAFAARAARSHVTVDLRVCQDATVLRADAMAAMTEFVAARSPAERTGASPVATGG